MNSGQPIYWHEGLFMRPQHFQQQDLFHQRLLRDFVGIVTPFPWGVSNFAVAESSLQNQILDVAQCELLFRDGTVARFPENAQINRRSLEDQWDPSGKPLAVYVGLRKIDIGEANVPLATSSGAQAVGASSGPQLAATRYKAPAQLTPTYDLYAREKPEEIAYLDYNLQIFLGNEAREAVNFELIKVMELARFGNEVRLVETFIPPLAHVRASEALVRLLRDLKEQLTARAHELAQYKQIKGPDTTEMSARELTYFLALQTLNRYVPLIHHMADAPRVTPWEFYGVLRQLVGELSSFSAEYDVFGGQMQSEENDGLPAYDHEDPGPHFKEAAESVTALLDELTAGPDYVATLPFDGTYYNADVVDRICHGNNRYYICVTSELPTDDMVHMVQTLAKLSSREYLPLLIARALPGVASSYLPSPPTVLPRRRGSVYFELDASSSAWAAVRDNLNLAMYVDNPPGEINVELMVVYG